MNIKAKTDYSTLFNSVSNSNSSVDTSFLSDYAQIKNGSYSKLMKAYYSKDSSKEVADVVNKKSSVQSDDAKENAAKLADTERSAENLYSTLKDLSETDFSKEDAASKVNSFVKGYNDLITKASDTDSDLIQRKALNLIDATNTSETALSKIGITIKDDDTLSFDEDVFKKAEASDIKGVFSTTKGYGFAAQTQASLIDSQAHYEQLKASTYTSSGNRDKSSTSGSIFDSLF